MGVVVSQTLSETTRVYLKLAEKFMTGNFLYNKKIMLANYKCHASTRIRMHTQRPEIIQHSREHMPKEWGT